MAMEATTWVKIRMKIRKEKKEEDKLDDKTRQLECVRVKAVERIRDRKPPRWNSMQELMEFVMKYANQWLQDN